MTSSADPQGTANIAPHESSLALPPDAPPPNASEQQNPRRNWLILAAALLVIAGGGFALWRRLGGRGQQQMMPQEVPVQLERLQTAQLEDSSEYVGTLDAQAGVVLQPEASGRITQIFASSGDRVAAGDPIMQLSPERSEAELSGALANVSAARSARDNARALLQAAEARRIELQADLELQQTEYERTESLVAQGAQAQQALDQVSRDLSVSRASLAAGQEEIDAARASLNQAEAALSQAQANASAVRQDLQDKTVTAPIAGIIGDIPVDLGDYVNAGATLTTITQNESLELELAVPIEAADRLRVGLPVELIPFGAEEAVSSGTISFISPQTTAGTQTVLAKARFSAPNRPLQDDQRLEVRVIWDRRPGVLVPATAINRIGGQAFVYVAEAAPPPEEGAEAAAAAGGNGAPSLWRRLLGQGNPPEAAGPPPPEQIASQRQVELGAIQGNRYQVLEGLEAGETIITSGLLNLRDGVPIVPQSEAESEGSAPAPPQ